MVLLRYAEGTDIEFETELRYSGGQPIQVVHFAHDMDILSSASYYGGRVTTRTVIFAQVAKDFMCSDIKGYIETILDDLALPRETVSFLTAAEVEYVFMVEEGWCHQGMTRIVTTPDMHARQQEMARLSDAAIVLPGGCGTMAELMELVTWKQLGLYLKPIVILNLDGFFDPLLEQLSRAAEENFMRREHLDIWRVAHSPEEALQLALSTPLWDKSVRRFAAI